MLRLVTIAVAIVASVGGAAAQNYYGNSGGYGTGSNPSSHSVQGHTNSNGSYTQPYTATNPNSTQLDNYGTRGNTNPSTGAMGSRSPRF